MIRGLYCSANGMLALMSKQDVIANNLANVNTPGFKRDYASITAFPEMLIQYTERNSVQDIDQQPIGYISQGVGISETGFIQSNGVLRQTGSKFDLALSGDGFFAVQTPKGEMFTRNGAFVKDAQNRLTDQNGNFVLGEQGPITVDGKEVVIDFQGRVMVDGKAVDTLKVRSFSKGELEKAGSNLFTATVAGLSSKDLNIKQGYLEGSNVEATNELVDMITVMRAYEANQRVLKAQDELVGKALEVGRIG